MATDYLIRIELHKGLIEPDYDELHELMEAAGFERHVMSEAGVAYQLPTAMYCGLSDLDHKTLRDVLVRIANHASPVGALDPWVLVCPWQRMAWWLEPLNLPKT